jgi:single-strand DNA-binding protein
MNKVLLIGRLTRDAELRYTPSGKAVASFTVAVQRNKEEADFINCVAWNKVAENLANYTSKGSLVGVEGSIQTRSYKNNEGKMVYVTEVWAQSVEFLSSKGKGSGEQKDANTEQNGAFERAAEWDDDPFANDGKPIDISDDDLPF